MDIHASRQNGAWRQRWYLLPIAMVLWLAGPATASADTVLFKQPTLTSLSNSFCVRCVAPKNQFHITQWESNPNTSTGEDTPSTQEMMKLTGLHSAHGGMTQLSLANRPDSSGVHTVGDAIGAYIRSSDLPLNTPAQKFIITPTIEFEPPAAVFAATNRAAALEVSFDLQVPVASDQHRANSASYVVSDIMFGSRSTGAKVYVNTIVFKNNAAQPTDTSFFDVPTKTGVAIGPITGATRLSNVQSGSEPFQARPWTGWKHFAYTVTPENLIQAVNTVNQRFPNLRLPTDSADWQLLNWHLNAEILFKDGPSELGWSLRNTKITQKP